MILAHTLGGGRRDALADEDDAGMKVEALDTPLEVAELGMETPKVGVVDDPRVLAASADHHVVAQRFEVLHGAARAPAPVGGVEILHHVEAALPEGGKQALE
jgi:hypothetical protein